MQKIMRWVPKDCRPRRDFAEKILGAVVGLLLAGLIYALNRPG